ncbi:MAG: aminoacyl-tRNA hydrolase [Flavobacteriales bacterium]|nr:aminoacyl-tRNA hydrolase [Flavobacteriales bacterium]
MLPKEEIRKELYYRASRSSGSGGQHVNKVETRVEAIFNVSSSEVLTETQKHTLRTKLGRKLNSEGELIVSSSESRSQFKNKEIATEKLLVLLESGLKKLPKRKPTSIPKAVKEKRLKEKRFQAEKKERRGFKP